MSTYYLAGFSTEFAGHESDEWNFNQWLAVRGLKLSNLDDEEFDELRTEYKDEIIEARDRMSFNDYNEPIDYNY
ncbi:hypothetical protein SAMN05444392_102264 [Seinonella peptonophila]|uniref:Uncharacterized protein n=1 Tax=Seinonella peptonophila TaxID=112248 RepID=A0A1M4VAR3_9BACL|nr:hypothetical protein [Seinonella peptonophila]SHE65967.1 hypothetical protein SAMN05444392_102264 [Seinonella peptonophila]